MKVKDLIEVLKEYDPELPVFKQDDDEGNSYSETIDLEKAQYRNDGELDVLHEDDAEPEDPYCIVIF